ncbi:RsmD family RNA methyltransferase [Candidatus Saccharibacteria bacterium]|nr:RsmD family RNA methyltransferase [Candidatus Saccharibacteria bacterium]
MEKIAVISGKFKGRKISTPGGATHPMGSREKLALFNMVSVEGFSVLDAFAGSGALGIEALSRGATSVTFVEKNSKAVEIIRENLQSLGVSEEAKIIKSSVLDAELSEFDVILADPPYNNFDLTEVESLIKSLKDGGIMVLSHPGEAPVLQGLELLKTHQYAAAHLSVYAK